MYGTNVPTTETTQERKPPTLADIVREKTDDGARIIDFFLDVMEERVDGAELCHRIDAAKQLEKHRSKAAAEFLAQYRDVPCGHSRRPAPGAADPCSDTVATARANAPGALTQDFLTVLSAVDQDLMTTLVRDQTADGAAVVQFLDDVMQDRLDGFKCHHRIAAAKELIVHIVRDEQPEPVPGSAHRRAEAQDEPDWMSWPWDWRHARRFALETPREALAKVQTDPEHPLHRYFKLDSDVRESLESVGAVIGPDGLLTGRDDAQPVHADPNSNVVPAEAGFLPQEPSPTQGGGEDSSALDNSIRTEPVLSTLEGSQLETDNSTPETLPGRQPGDARASTHPEIQEPQHSKEDDEQDRPARKRSGIRLILGPPDEEPGASSTQLTPTERRIRQRLKDYQHDPGPWGAPIDSTTPGRSPP